MIYETINDNNDTQYTLYIVVYYDINQNYIRTKTHKTQKRHVNWIYQFFFQI